MLLTEEIGVKHLEEYGDSKLISTKFVEGTKSDMKTYHNATINMTEKFISININHVPHQHNAHADVLASLAASLALPTEATEKVLVHSHDL